jgi:hypothetical protein
MTRVVTLAAAWLAAGVAVGSVSGATAARPSGFACYPAQFSAFTAQKLALSDPVARRRLSLLAFVPDHVCAPTGDPAAIADVTTYGTCYTVKSSAFAQRDVRLRDSLGKLTMRVLRPTSVCVPTARIDGAPTATPSTMLGLYTCYAAKPRSSLAGKGTDVSDVFGRATESVSLATRLCAPASTETSTQNRPYFTCYAVESEVTASTVLLRNDWGSLKASPGPRDYVCLSARRAL